jgi:hypothetical protein
MSEGMYGVLDALENIIRSATEAKRTALEAALDTYADEFSEEFDWAISGQSPALLHHLMMCIDLACHPAKPGRVIRLVNRDPEGSA